MKPFITLLLLLTITISVTAQDWTVPADRKARLSPFKFTVESVKGGEKLYNINCKSCHGTPGMANFQANLKPQPPDPVTEKLQGNTDGELYYKISTGRGPMPSFRNSLSAAETWTVISYLRSFNKNYSQLVAPVIKSALYPGAEIVIALIKGPADDEVSMKVSAISEKSTVPVKSAGVRVFVNRTFGKMMLDEEKTTDNNGTAVFKVPAGLPADTAGNLRLSAGFTDEDTFGAVTKDTILKAGVRNTAASLTQDRAMWNVVRKAPIWVLLTYTLGVLAVWGVIMVILLKLREVYLVGEHLEKAGKSEASNS
jgi:hypothetical protein